MADAQSSLIEGVHANQHWHDGKRLVANFSVVTLHYRGARYLDRLLKNLTTVYAHSPSFEWILVDDFSDDNGASLAALKRTVESAPFPATVISLRSNHYGARSTEEAAKLASGKYIVILDQDDGLVPDALETFGYYAEKYATRADFAGVCGRCVGADGRLTSQRFPEDEQYMNELEVRHLLKIRGELFQCTKRELIANAFAHLMPGNTNGLAWSLIAKTHKFVYINKVVRQYDNASPTSMTHAKRVRHVGSVFRQSQQYLQQNWRYATSDPIEFLRMIVHCGRWSLHSEGRIPIHSDSMPLMLRGMFILTSPVSWLLFKRDLSTGLVTRS